ncbi:hypothetical protein MCAP1_000866 [Malassezia caprae]|uniref:pH-response regulator protein palC n=1 Tax=Malassezia caprae TaxID=1381934 RepID=A0AAF0E5N3_9BASI|nr:hypothetical protein MCAP1_000866 [Malassezia caprae]
MFQYTPPRTSALSFVQLVFSDTLQAELMQATQLRATLEQLLRQEPQVEPLRLVQAVSEYLPYAQALYDSMLRDTILLKQEPTFTWRSILVPSTQTQVCGLAGELSVMHVLYGIALSNEAAAIVEALGAYEVDRSLSTTERRARDERLKVATDLLSRASGVLDHAATHVLPVYERSGPTARPLELTANGLQALSRTALADAHALAIRKLQAPALAQATDTLTPGPPLPAGHPSPSLLAKLHLHTSSLYHEAHALLGQSVRAPASHAKLQERLHKMKLDPRAPGAAVLPYMQREAQWHQALAYKWLGVDAGEQEGDVGWGMAYLRKSLELLQALVPRTALDALRGARRPGAVRFRTSEERMALEHASVSRWLGAYTKTNDTVAFKRVPPLQEVPQYTPEGRPALFAKPFEPRCAFHVDAVAPNAGLQVGSAPKRTYTGADAYY